MVEVVKLAVREQEEKAAFVRTPTAERITTALQVCHQFGELGVVVGDPGTGKTFAAAEYARGTKNVRMVTIDRMTRELVPCLMHVAQRLTRRDAPNTGAAAVRAVIIAKLKDLVIEGQVLLIIDEAQHLSDDAIEAFRAIYDEFEERVGLVFIGNRGLVDRWSGRRRENWAQLMSRVGPYIDIPSGSIEDLDAFCGHHGITGARERDFVRKLAPGGGIRTAAKLLKIAGTLAGAGPVQLTHLQQAALARGVRA